MDTDTATPLEMGADFEAVIPENSHPGHRILVRDMTAAGTWTGLTVAYSGVGTGPKQLLDTVWSMRYAALYHFNDSPWVEHDYVGPVSGVRLIGPSDPIPTGVWVLELLDESDQPGALGYHEGQAHISKKGSSGTHSERGIALHPEASEEIVVSKVFVHTSRADGVPITEVATHELFEMMVDPYVNTESEIRKYLNTSAKEWYIGEVGDPVQSRAWDVGAPEGRPCGVPEALISDFAYPAWWGQQQRRAAVCFCDDAESWVTLPTVPHLVAWEIPAGGYMSVAPENEPTKWSQIQGAETKPGGNPE